MPKVTHFLIVADKVERAIRFYTKVLGWRFRKAEYETDYWVIETGEENGHQVMGGLMERSDPLDSPVVTFDVPSLDAAVENVKELGGRIIRPRVSVHGVGYVQYCEDSEGNLFGMIEFRESAQ